MLPLCAGAKESCIIEAELPFAAALRPAHTIPPLLLALLTPAVLLLLLLHCAGTAQCCVLLLLVPVWRSIIVVPIIVAKLSNVQLLAQPGSHLLPAGHSCCCSCSTKCLLNATWRRCLPCYDNLSAAGSSASSSISSVAFPSMCSCCSRSQAVLLCLSSKGSVGSSSARPPCG
jgi:hypothetical protein